MLIDILKVFIL